MLSLISDIKTMNTAYESLIGATNTEMISKERNFEAQLLSQAGFAFDEIKQLQYSFGYEIDERSMAVDNPECIAIARIRLNSEADNAGTASTAVFEEVIEEISYIRVFSVYPSISELTRLTHNFAFEPFALLAYFNSVSEQDSIFNVLDNEILLYTELFEGFVDEIISEMADFDRFYWNMNHMLAQSLISTRQGFVNSTDEIRDFLLTECV